METFLSINEFYITIKSSKKKTYSFLIHPNSNFLILMYIQIGQCSSSVSLAMDIRSKSKFMTIMEENTQSKRMKKNDAEMLSIGLFPGFPPKAQIQLPFLYCPGPSA